MTLYLKYRSQTIEELDSEKVRQQLKNLISSDRLPHAFLFSGPKGTGKTSTARILAKIINCEKNKEKLGEPCNKCEYCLATSKGSNFDVIEMDAASNRGIDDIRSLKEKIILSPGSARKKIYIIDEVHMLTTEAFNALLKTLEEPPAHVIFILATTDPQKLPDTVKSRLTNINFEKAKEGEIIRQLQRVAKGEGIKVEDDVLSLISKASDGAFRDAVKTFEELLINLKELTFEKVNDYLFKNKLLDSIKLLNLISENKLNEAILSIEEYANNGGSIKNLVSNMTSDLHDLLLVKLGVVQNEENKLNFSIDQIATLSGMLNQITAEVNTSSIAQLPLELTLVKFLSGSSKDEESEVQETKSATKEQESKKKDFKVDPPPISKKVEAAPVIQKEPEQKDNNVLQEKTNIGDLTAFSDQTWFKLLQSVRSKNASIEAFMRAAKPFGMDEQGLTVGVYYRFHKEQLELVNNRRIIEESLSELVGNNTKINFIITEKADSKPSIVSNISSPSLTEQGSLDIIDAAKEIFGN